MQSRQMRRNRKRWERKTGRFLLLASRFSLLLIMTGLLLFHGGRDAEGWGLAGMLLSLTLVCWAAGCLFSGKVALMPTQGPLVFGLVLGMGLLQLSPFIGGLWAPEGIKGFWAALQIAELPSGSPLLALLPGFHSQALLFLLSAAVFQFLLVQLFGGPSGILLLSFAVLCCAALMSLLGLVQHFGGHDWLLWMYKGKTFAVSGPLPNKNHFALLQELGFFTGLGCACGLFSARKGASLWLLAGKWRRPLLAATLACLVLCLLGLFFSYSRAGILCSLVGVIAFSLYAFRRLGDTKSSFMALAVLLVAIGLVSFYGLDVLTSRLEVALSGEDPSGLVRWEIWKTALSVIGLSPFWGTGFGAFRYLSPLFEPSYAPGTISFNVHNDFMELAVVLGIPCALLVLGWLAYLFWRNARWVLAAPRSSLHFVGVGAMAALLVTAGHEVFDYGLQQPGNMLVWLAVTVVLSHAARWGYARKKNDQWELGRPLYVLAILLCIPVFVMLKAYSECYHAGIALNRMNELRELPEVTQAFSAAVGRFLKQDSCAWMPLTAWPMPSANWPLSANRCCWPRSFPRRIAGRFLRAESGVPCMRRTFPVRLVPCQGKSATPLPSGTGRLPSLIGGCLPSPPQTRWSGQSWRSRLMMPRAGICSRARPFSSMSGRVSSIPTMEM